MKKFLVSLCFAAGCFGQNSLPVQVQQLFNNASAGATSSLVQNVGQPFHMVYTWLSDAPGHTCTIPPAASTTIPTTQIQVSYDGVVFQNASNALRVLQPNGGGPTNRYRYLVSASGEFGWVKVAITNPDPTNCQYSAWYAGGPVGVDITRAFTLTSNPTTGDTATPVGIDISSATTTTVFPAQANSQIGVYGLFLYNSTAAQSVTIGYGGGNCGAFTGIFKLDTVAANQIIFNQQTSANPLVLVPASCALQILTSGTGPLSGYVTAEYQ